MTAARGASFFRRAFARRVRPNCAIGIEAKSAEFRAEEVPFLILDPLAGPIVVMAATNKHLAQSSKSADAANATKKRERRRQV